MIKAFKLLGIILLLGVLYFAFWPVPVDPKVWDAPSAPPMAGPYEVNSKLAGYHSLSLDGLTGPEAVTQDAQGLLYAATHEGWILRWTPELTAPKKWVNVGGRPLGIAFDANQNLWVANAYLGLQKVTPKGEISLEATETEGVAIRYADDLVVVPDGRLFFSDASTKFVAGEGQSTLAASLLDILEHGDYGRIIEFDPTTGNSKVIMRDLTFANGVSADPNGEYILVAETGSYRVWKYWLKGSKAGQSEVLMDNLPGFPDNIHRGQDGRFWVGFPTPRASILDDLADKPFWRKVVQRMPAFLRPNVENYGHVIAINGEGEVLHSLQDPKGPYPATTGVWETDAYLYVTSLTAPELARIDKKSVGVGK